MEQSASVDALAAPTTPQDTEEEEFDVGLLDVTHLLAYLRADESAEEGKEPDSSPALPPRLPLGMLAEGEYTPLLARYASHDGHVDLPSDMRLLYFTPPSMFHLLFTWEDVAAIAKYSNQYAALHCASEWKTVTVNEFSIWLDIVIYMGTFNITRPRDCWTEDSRYPQYPFTKFMSRNRFTEIRRYFHVSSPGATFTEWFGEVEPLASTMRDRFKRYYVPPTNVSIDKMIVRFPGWSAHAVRMKDKPTPEGYKVVSLASQGYCYSFEFVSRIDGANVPAINGLSATNSLVAVLALQLPYATHQFNVYMDNYFTSIPLFSYLRARGVGACGTVRSISAKYPKDMCLRGSKLRLDWNTLQVKAVSDVLVVCWVDNGPVQLYITIHRTEGDDWFVTRNRRRPRETSTNADTVRRMFDEASRKELKISKIIDDYNHNMNGVDVADQYRAYYSIQLISSRTWTPLFYWLVDTALINAYVMFKSVHFDKTMAHKDFWLHVAWSLMLEGVGTNRSTTRKRTRGALISPVKPTTAQCIYVTSGSLELPGCRFMPGAHCSAFVEGRLWCLWYRVRRCASQGRDAAPQTSIVCSYCNVPLCFSKKRYCFSEFHEQEL